MKRALKVVSLVCALVGVTGACAATQATSETPASRMAQCTPVPVDTGNGFVYGLLESESPDAGVSRETLAAVLDRIAVSLINDTLTFDPVDRLFDIVVMRIGPEPDPRPMMMPLWAAHPGLTTEIAFTLSEQGDLRAPEVVANGDGTIAATLLRGIDATPAITAVASSRPHRLRLRLALSPDTTAVSAPLIAARQLRHQAKPPRQVPGHGAPRAPVSGTGGRTDATVLTWFMVDANGEAVAASFVAAPPADESAAKEYRPFVDAVKRALPNMRHEPAVAGGCPTARRVALAVKFGVEPREQAAHGRHRGGG